MATRRRGDAATRRRKAKKAAAAPTVPASPSPRVPASSTSAADQAHRDRGNAALKKQLNGEALTASEANAIAKLERLSQKEQLRAAYRRATGEDLRGLLGCTRMQLTRYVAYGMPRNEDGTYNLAMALPWLLEHERARVRKEGEKAVDALEVYRRSRAEEAQLAVARRKGEVLPADLVENEEERAGRVVAEELLSWENTLAPRLAGLEPRAIKAILADEARRVLDRLVAAVSTAAEKKRERNRAS